MFGDARQVQDQHVIEAGEMPLIICENGEAGGEAEYATKARRYKYWFIGLIIAGGMVALAVLCAGFFVVLMEASK